MKNLKHILLWSIVIITVLLFQINYRAQVNEKDKDFAELKKSIIAYADKKEELPVCETPKELLDVLKKEKLLRQDFEFNTFQYFINPDQESFTLNPSVENL